MSSKLYRPVVLESQYLFTPARDVRSPSRDHYHAIFRRQSLTSPRTSQVAIIGGASGMGLATAQPLASRGASVSTADINAQGLEAALATLADPGRHMCAVVDVRRSANVDAWIADTVKRYGRLDGAVNMAGIISPAKPIVEETDERWDLNFEVNTLRQVILRCTDGR
ncbi:hypothetical protein F4778DRAFT_801034 [Xylariomycetidae sp. FL2044]|nr:hypothetical protein F4778DRAFT_801034 [Xylariomycetidae sp. FL2044]